MFYDHLTEATAGNCTNGFCLAPNFPITAKVLDVLDGDTLRCAIRSPITGSLVSITVRLAGIDTAETHARREAEHPELEKSLGIITRLYVSWLLGAPVGLVDLPDTENATSRKDVAQMFADNRDIVFVTPRLSVCSKIATTYDSFGRVVADVSSAYGHFRGLAPGSSLSSLLLSIGAATPFSKQKHDWTKEEIEGAVARMRACLE